MGTNIISSRTPEGDFSRCILCGHQTHLEFSSPADDAPCPNCGHLLWRSREVFQTLQGHLANSLQIDASQITPNFPIRSQSDSLDTVELVMQLEESFDISLSQNITTQTKTAADLTRQILKIQQPPQ